MDKIIQLQWLETDKEVREEAGLNVKAIRRIATQDRNLHNTPLMPTINEYRAVLR